MFETEDRCSSALYPCSCRVLVPSCYLSSTADSRQRAQGTNRSHCPLTALVPVLVDAEPTFPTVRAQLRLLPLQIFLPSFDSRVASL